MPTIEVAHLHKRYRDTVAVEDVSFTVERGEIFGIVGPNGAGKTTTVETIEGLRTPDRGTVRVLGLDPWRDRAELRRLQLVARGTTNREAARRLFISEASVKAHLLHVYTKLGVNDRAAAVAAAYERGLLTPGGGLG